MSKLSDQLAASLTEGVPHPPEFTLEQRRILLGIARTAIAASLVGEPLPDAPPLPWPALLQQRGVFTTLYLCGQLRGCVGYALPIRPLFRAIAETARAAAFEDSRFWPVTTEEARELKVSLSVLSPLFPVNPTEVEVGRHGLVISDGIRRGLLLPQVPIEHAWDRETFLDQTCHKAGLPLNAWRRPGIDIQAFTAEVFGDENFSQ
jgi:AmmeMemoRadiSam system protein A